MFYKKWRSCVGVNVKINEAQKISFQRNLTKRELKSYKKTLKSAKEALGQNGKSVFIMPSTTLPQSPSYNSGIGHLSSDYAQEYIDYMRDYLDFNVVQDLPQGQIKSHGDFYCAYNGTSFALGNQQINPELLTSDEFANLLTKDEVEQIAKANCGEYKDYLSNFKNVASNLGKQNEILNIAYQRFLKLDKNHPLVKQFNDFCQRNAFWLDIKLDDETNQEFFKFKQFLADSHLKIAKEKLNKKGLKLCGDCLLRFRRDEINAYPNAFNKNLKMGEASWDIPALDFDTILDKNSDSYKILKQKVQLCAKRYDMIRFDVGWQYIKPKMSTKDGKTIIKDLGSSLLEEIESWVKEVKGDDFDLNNLLWEVEADAQSFRAFESDGKLIKPLQNRVKIYSSTWMHHNDHDKWGYNDAYLDRGWSKEEFILGPANHDPQPLVQIAHNIADDTGSKVSHKKDNITALSHTSKMTPSELENPKTFISAKWADTMSAHNNYMFYMDVFGREERFDRQEYNLFKEPHKNYAYKVPADYKKQYHQSLQKGLGFNPMDASLIAFRAKGLDKKYPKLYKKILHFNNILKEEGMVEDNGIKSIFKTMPKPLKITIFASLIVLLGGLLAYKKSKANRAQNTKVDKSSKDEASCAKKVLSAQNNLTVPAAKDKTATTINTSAKANDNTTILNKPAVPKMNENSMRQALKPVSMEEFMKTIKTTKK